MTSLRFDYRLAEQDIVGSIGWSKALVSVGILTADEQVKLEAALLTLKAEVEADPEQILRSDAEDIHSWVEGKLIERVGDLGKKLHTGRSRNDQVATDLKLWCKQQGNLLLESIHGLQSKLVATARQYQTTRVTGIHPSATRPTSNIFALGTGLCRNAGS